MDKLETLDDIIIESGLKIGVIADRLDISSNYLWRIRKEPTKMDADFMVKLAGVLGVEADRVFNAIKNEVENS